MPVCEKCKTTWSWRQTLKTTMTLNPAMICPYCNEKQYQTQKSKTKTALLTPITLSPLLLQLFFDLPGILLLSLFPVIAVVMIALYPYLVELSSEERYIGDSL